MRRSLALVALLVLAASACGGADAGDPRTVAAAWLLALYDSDGERACDLLDEESARRATEAARAEALRVTPSLPESQLPDCATVYGRLGEAVGESLAAAGLDREALVRADPSALAADLQGDTATATLADGVRVVHLRRVGDAWRVVVP